MNYRIQNERVLSLCVRFFFGSTSRATDKLNQQFLNIFFCLFRFLFRLLYLLVTSLYKWLAFLLYKILILMTVSSEWKKKSEGDVFDVLFCFTWKYEWCKNIRNYQKYSHFSAGYKGCGRKGADIFYFTLHQLM